MKRCCTCKKDKFLSEFSKNNRSKDGLSNACKPCAKRAAKEWRQKNNHDGRVVAKKHCFTCDKTKICNDFYNDKSRKDGLSNQCKFCIKQYRKNNREKLLIKAKTRNKMNAEREKIKVTGRVCAQCNKYKDSEYFWKSKHTIDGLYSSCIDCKKKLESTEHRRKVRTKNRRDWRKNNLQHSKDYHNNWQRNKCKIDIGFKLRKNVASAVVASIRNYNYYNNKVERFKKTLFAHLPYTSEELKQHLESQFEPWMNWDNYGKYDFNRKTWQIDHIIPQSKLPFTSFDDKNFQKCWSLENLRPLEVIENIKKGSKVYNA